VNITELKSKNPIKFLEVLPYYVMDRGLVYIQKLNNAKIIKLDNEELISIKLKCSDKIKELTVTQAINPKLFLIGGLIYLIGNAVKRTIDRERERLEKGIA